MIHVFFPLKRSAPLRVWLELGRSVCIPAPPRTPSRPPLRLSAFGRRVQGGGGEGGVWARAGGAGGPRRGRAADALASGRRGRRRAACRRAQGRAHVQLSAAD
eukprot:881326-Pleurochrysis_carterae.AAC.1